MRVGIHHASLGIVDWSKAFELASGIGADGVVLSYHDRPAPGEDLREVDPVAYWSDPDRHRGLDIIGLYMRFLADTPSLIGPASRIAKAQDHIVQALSVAARMKAGSVIIPFLGRNRIEFDRELERAAEALREMVSEAERVNVPLSIQSTLNYEKMRYLIDHTDDRYVKICFDTAIATASRFDPAILIRSLGPAAISQVDFNDVRLAATMAPQFSVDLGQGEVDFDGVARALWAMGYNGWVVVVTPPGDEAGDIARANLLFARNVLRIEAAQSAS